MSDAGSLDDINRCPLATQAARRPETLALAAPGERWTYAEMEAAVAATAGQLADAGITPEDRVAVHLPRGVDLVVLLWALWRRGAVAALLSTRLPPPAAVASARRVGAGCIVTRAAEVAASARASAVTVLAPSTLVSTHTGRRDGPDAATPRNCDAPRWDLDRDATLVFTSGSTGPPKAALHTLRNHVASAAGSNRNLPVGPGDRWLLSLPLYHVGGLAVLFRCALGGGAAVLPDPDAPLAAAVATSRATHLSLVATQLRRLLEAGGADGVDAGSEGEARRSPPTGLSAVLVGGGPVPSGLLDRAVDRGWPVHTTYGCTEMASQVTTTAPGASRDALATAGRVLPYRRLRIAGGTGPGTPGEILLRGPTLFRGYVRPAVEAGEATDAPTEAPPDPSSPRGPGLDPARDLDGWYHSGDRGFIDDRDRLHVVGRTDRMFVSGGENIQPEEIEAVLEAEPGVQRAAVVPVKSETYGARPVAFVAAEEMDGKGWARRLSAQVPRYKVPDAFHELPSAAVSGRMKIDHDLLQQRAERLRRTME